MGKAVENAVDEARRTLAEEGVGDLDILVDDHSRRGFGARRDDVDAMIVGALDQGWTVARLELLLRAVLRVGTYELMDRPETPAKVVIDEYIEVAHAFFGKGPPGFVNGVLDRLAHQLRPGEFDAA